MLHKRFSFLLNHSFFVLFFQSCNNFLKTFNFDLLLDLLLSQLFDFIRFFDWDKSLLSSDLCNLTFDTYPSVDLCEYLLLTNSPLESFLEHQSSLLSLRNRLDCWVEIANTPPYSLDKNRLLPSLSDPFHDLAAESLSTIGFLKLDYDGQVLTGEIHYALSPTRTVGVCKDHTLDGWPRFLPFICTFYCRKLSHLCLDHGSFLRFQPV